ncbi:hypothetical protein EDC94DRAFT_230469 [Helicostylum pulchrum]|nr:hypothetical protein EDC94DRAFT_230469 [Helicostylum pulchrum]
MTFLSYTASISVLKNFPGRGESVNSSNLQWFMNYELDLSKAAIAGIVIGISFFFFAVNIFLLRKYVMGVRRAAIYVQKNTIWNIRLGEPVWAEVSRVVARCILSVLFLSFVVYLTYKSVNSSTFIQRVFKDSDAIRIPDTRFCFNGFNETNDSTPYVRCLYKNGTNCSDRIIGLNRNKQSPFYESNLGYVSCSMFIPGTESFISNNNLGYTDSSINQVNFFFFCETF